MHAPGVSPEDVGDRRNEPFSVTVFDMEEPYLVVASFIFHATSEQKEKCFKCALLFVAQSASIIPSSV
jgi:hypothetical protein